MKNILEFQVLISKDKTRIFSLHLLGVPLSTVFYTPTDRPPQMSNPLIGSLTWDLSSSLRDLCFIVWVLFN